MNELVTNVFGPPLKAILGPINTFLVDHYLPWATICAMALFLGAIAWVWTLKSEYVNLDQPKPGWYYDLRLWTVLCLLPHIVAYLYFSKWS